MRFSPKFITRSGAQDESVLKHKVPSDTDFSARTCYTRYLENSDRLRSLDIRWRHVDASSSRLFKGSAPQNGGYRVQRAKEALLVTEKREPKGRGTQERI